MNSPQYSGSGNYVAQSAKVKRKGIAKTNMETNLPLSTDKMQML